MAFSTLQLRRLVLLVSLSLPSSATDHRHKEPDSDSSNGSHDVFNRTVVLNSASERYLAMIFHDYSDNTTGKIFAARFKDLLRDLNLGEKVPVTKTSSLHEQESSESRDRHSRSYDEQAGEFGEFARRSKFSGQRSGQKRSNAKQSKREAKSQLNFVSHGSPARSRDRKRRNMENHGYSLDEYNEVSC